MSVVPTMARFLRHGAIVALALIGLTLAAASLDRVLAQVPTSRTAPSPAAGQDAVQDAVQIPPRARIDAFKTDLDQVETTLARPELTEADLLRLRDRVEPALNTIRDAANTLAPRADAVKARLDQLGPKPDDKSPPESPDVAGERDERQKEYNDLNETLLIGRALLVQAKQLTATIADRRRTIFARTLFKRSESLLSPDLWLSVAQSLPRDIIALRIVAGDWMSSIATRAAEGRILALFLALGAAVALYAARWRLAPRLEAREASISNPTRLRRATTAAVRTLASTVPAAIAAFLVKAGLNGANLLPPRIEPVISAILGGLVFVAFARSLGDAMLAPGRSAWRLIDVSDATAERLYRLVFIASGVMVLGKVLEEIFEAIASGLQVTVAIKGVIAAIFALLLVDTLRRIRNTEACEEDSFGPYVATEPSIGAPLRVACWFLAVLVVADVLAGFVVFASFLVDQIVWVASIASVLTLLLILIDDAIIDILSGDGRVSVGLQSGIGLRKRSLEQIAVLLSGFLRLSMILIAGMLALAPWGVESGDLLSSLRAAFFGFKVGDVTISLSTIVVALILFLIGLGATRAIQRWLDSKYLPATQLDAGLRNSIKTGFGYLGFGVTAAIAFSQLGLSLDKIAIVAGALSVGIGFGLQSIVNNFVSGLILLWERPIKVGDWVVVGEEQGYVRRINVRSTEIETFERASVIVPNSNLISGVVKNWIHSDRIGRVNIKIGVSYTADPVEVSAILVECARAHELVLEKPAPLVLFSGFGVSSLDFDMYCFIGDVETRGQVASDLRFTILRTLRERGIGIPFPQQDMNVKGLDGIEETLRRLAPTASAGGAAAEPSPDAATTQSLPPTDPAARTPPPATATTDETPAEAGNIAPATQKKAARRAGRT